MKRKIIAEIEVEILTQKEMDEIFDGTHTVDQVLEELRESLLVAISQELDLEDGVTRYHVSFTES